MTTEEMHVCEAFYAGCSCGCAALAPDYNCEVHGEVRVFRRCLCGRFTKAPNDRLDRLLAQREPTNGEEG